MDRISASEICAGLIFTGKKDDINVDYLIPDYQEAVERYRKGAKIEELITSYGEPILSAIHAAESLNGTTKYNWNEVLSTSYHTEELARQLENKVKSLRDGKEVDFSDVDLNIKTDDDVLKRASDVEAMEIPLITSGCEPIDRVVGGVPSAGLITFLSYTSTGKTTFALGFVDWFLSKHKDKVAIVFSTEMVEEENKMRLEEIGAKNFDRIYLVNYQGTVNGILPIAKQVSNVGLIVVDMLDDLIKGEVTEPKMSEVYQTLSGISRSRELRVPILATALPHRSRNKILKPHNLRWSSMAEGRSYMIISLYNPMKNTAAGTEDEPMIPRFPGVAWLCVWKVRGGIRVDKYKDMPQCAIPIGWKPDVGFANKFLPRPTVFNLDDEKKN